ncbi:13606_t:CDS:2 [Cetraspora pellucida]|uniref:13606_t:CDS:1 n=1 Tax=Cetraspora pellucida TaxID=1433469 RepID=A0ACA9K3F4_9GLOM|nr:13606_t:CDS:2 [Cetraspora pellucida]
MNINEHFIITHTLLILPDDKDLNFFDDKDLTCEKLFNVSSCNDCQELIFHDFKQDEDDCPAAFKFVKEITKVIKESDVEKVDPYDSTYFKKGLENYCDLPFNCDPQTAKKYWTKIEDVCSEELNNKIDWSSDPKKMDTNTILVFGTLFTYYFGNPARHAYCYKSSNSDDFCVVKIYENILEYTKKVTDEDPEPTYSLDIKYVFKKDGTRIPIPKKLVCDEECYESIAKMYKSWIKQYKLNPKVIENIFGSEDEFIDYLSCKPDDKRGVQRTSGSCLSPLHSSFFF